MRSRKSILSDSGGDGHVILNNYHIGCSALRPEPILFLVSYVSYSSPHCSLTHSREMGNKTFFKTDS